MTTWREIELGDRAYIKGVRSSINGRRREIGEVVYLNKEHKSAVVRAGITDYHVRLTDLILYKKKED